MAEMKPWELERVFNVYGDPVPMPRPRYARTPKGVHAYIPDGEARPVREYQRKIRAAFVLEGWWPVDPNTSILLEATFLLRRPKTGKGRHTVDPITESDLDNLEKSVMDALGTTKTAAGVAYENDSQVVSKRTVKRYADGVEPMTHIRVALLRVNPWNSK